MSKRVPSVEQFTEIGQAFQGIVQQCRYGLRDPQANKEERALKLARFATALRAARPRDGHMKGWPDGVEAAFRDVVDALDEVEPYWSTLKGQQDNPLFDAFWKLQPFLSSDQIASVQKTAVARPAGANDPIWCTQADVLRADGLSNRAGYLEKQEAKRRITILERPKGHKQPYLIKFEDLEWRAKVVRSIQDYQRDGSKPARKNSRNAVKS